MAYARTSWVWVAAGAGVLLIAAWWVSAVWHDPTVADPAPYILSAMERCYSSSKQSPCYRDAAKDFVAKFSPAAIATVFAAHESEKSIFEFCHETMHYAGQESYRRLGNVAAALAEGSTACFAGYYHGVLEGYLTERYATGMAGASALAAEVPELCGERSRFQTDKEFHECLHGLGHALMFATETDLPASLRLCDTLSSPEEAGWCYSGAFMENSTSSTNKDHPSRYLKDDDLLYPCSILEEKYLPMCYNLQGLYFAERAGYDWQKTGELCALVPRRWQDYCFNAIGQSIAGSSRDPQTLKAGCETITDMHLRGMCVVGLVGAVGERYEDGIFRAKEICDIENVEYKKICYERVMQKARESGVPSQDIGRMCADIAEEYRDAVCAGF
ncbi:MAG: hypothetical protein A3C84_00950 [Candidatus Ryanbacteria bacterium RIFCSPHIGHO2_02_FULL_48_12]|uniref:Uncharacterized protein n=1 Tax=Candidatus Ryanbacteria bacterium RIFCSPHIGHO2_01_FULL_48_27 TaxID=1802115 RepID=A0A1G2G3T6_9BACT|nr:MAG: hypothetical protein A2756_03465 [Candidatus Ryanbacteria bacterium RIFCSPHIGHO2_01_FULL_48_27]OGZ50689.1 MAG: hypothetical protein A3C84_00950 [Candidatus Ryanbacteria bacterium RIFCSPHIGHO2_02_FULL_48_12]